MAIVVWTLVPLLLAVAFATWAAVLSRKAGLGPPGLWAVLGFFLGPVAVAALYVIPALRPTAG